MVDPNKRAALIKLICSQPEHINGRALVSVKEFFDGNGDFESIGCNLSDHPGLDYFRRVLESINKRSDVEKVWMQIYDFDEGAWPYCENVLIFGDAPLSIIRSILEPLGPSEISEMMMDWSPSRDQQLTGCPYINAWWD